MLHLWWPNGPPHSSALLCSFCSWWLQVYTTDSLRVRHTNSLLFRLNIVSLLAVSSSTGRYWYLYGAVSITGAQSLGRVLCVSTWTDWRFLIVRPACERVCKLLSVVLFCGVLHLQTDFLGVIYTCTETSRWVFITGCSPLNLSGPVCATCFNTLKLHDDHRVCVSYGS
jgi:hypothetical protein